MPCCTLIAFVLSQLGLGAGVARLRFVGRFPFAIGAPLGGWKTLGLAAVAGLEIVLASAALPVILTEHGRAQAAGSFQQAWHVCAVKLDALGETVAPKN